MQTTPLVGVHSTAIDPVLTTPQRVGARGQQALSEVAGAQHLALTQRQVSEVITGGTAAMALEGIKLPAIQETPLLHQPLKAVQLYS